MVKKAMKFRPVVTENNLLVAKLPVLKGTQFGETKTLNRTQIHLRVEGCSCQVILVDVWQAK